MNKLFAIVLLFLILTYFVQAKTENDVLDRAEKISSEIRDNYSFKGDIKFYSKEIKVGNAETRRYPGSYRVIIDTEQMKEISDDELKGLLAHELSHLEDYSKLNWIELAVLALKYSFSENFRIKYEKSTDIKAIEKGFGKELLAFRIYDLRIANEEEKVLFEKNYLSPEEIENFTNSMAF